MAKHSTHKASSNGKREALARKAKRAVKYATAELNVDYIMSTLDRPMVGRMA